MSINNVRFEIRVCLSTKTGRDYLCLVAVCPYGDFVVSFDRQVISNISNLTASDLASLKVGDVIIFV